MVDDKEIEYWITVNGNHIPVKRGQTKTQAVDEFLKEKDDVRGYSAKELKERQEQELPQTYSLPDEKLPISLSARWMNYEIELPNGKIAHFAEGSKLQNKEVFAGKGCKRKIDEEERLVREYHQPIGSWMKVKARAVLVDETGKEFNAEVHWYETKEGGKEEIKFKRFL